MTWTSRYLKTDVMDLDDDDIDDDKYGPQYRWFQRPAPATWITFVVAGILLVLTLTSYYKRVGKVRSKFGREFKGSLRFCAEVSVYMDNEEPTFAMLRLITKSFVFLGFLQIGYNPGFLVMLALLVLESSLDTFRVLLAYWNFRSVRDVRVASEDEARELRATTTLEPTNVYEDLTRPRSIAIMVFVVQSLLIGIVMYDSYHTPTRTCFDGTDGCPMLASLGSYCLYLMGTFMACVFYVGPLNSYGKKEHDPVFWLKLFLMSKQSSSVVSWRDSVTDQVKTMALRKDDWRVWLRFIMSFVINDICFHFLLHVLPIQIASKSSILGVVYSAVGMIYLVDLDDTTGNTMTLVPRDARDQPGMMEQGYNSIGQANGDLDSKTLASKKQKIIDDAMKEVKAKFEALVFGKKSEPHHLGMHSITHALYLSTQKTALDENDTRNEKTEKTALLSA